MTGRKKKINDAKGSVGAFAPAASGPMKHVLAWIGGIGALCTIYFGWEAHEASKQNSQRELVTQLAESGTIAASRAAEFQDYIRHLILRRQQLAVALASPSLAEALATPQMHFVMSDDWKAAFATTPDEIRLIAKTSPDIARNMAECVAQGTQINTSLSQGRDEFNAGPAPHDPQGIEFKATLDIIKSQLKNAQAVCMLASDGLWSLEYPTREPIGHSMEDRVELIIVQLEKHQIDLTFDPSALKSDARR